MSVVAQMVARGSALFAGIAPDLAMASAMPAPKQLMLLATLLDRAGPPISKAIGELIILKGDASSPVTTKSVLSLDMPADRLDTESVFSRGPHRRRHCAIAMHMHAAL